MNGTLALTISPPDRETRYAKNTHIFTDDAQIINRLLRQCCSRWIIYPELDLSGRLHYHGMIVFKDVVKYYKSVRYSLQKMGYVCIKPIKSFKDRLGWIIYMSKQWGYTKDILNIDRPIMNMIKQKKVKTIEMPHGLDNGIEQYFKIIP